MIGGIAIKDRRLIIPFLLQKQILQQLHSNYMNMEKMRLPACVSVYWVNINKDNENTMKHYDTCIEYQQTQPHEMIVPCEMLHKV